MRVGLAAAVLAWCLACAAPPEPAVTVFAASSLTGAFTEMGQALAKTHVRVRFNFAASSLLVQQIDQGARADVFATADEATLHAEAHAKDPIVFAHNTLEIVVPSDNPKRVRALADLAEPGVTVALCASQVPCGTFADRVLAGAGVTVRSPSREENVKAVLNKVALGEADAGIVYVTDVLGAKHVAGVPIPQTQNVAAAYPIAILDDAPNAAGARRFVDFVTSKDGRAILRRFGFLP